MSYRVESALTGRAVCVETVCKAAGIKIDKDELRLGVWVEFPAGASFRWKHWGCVTGKQLQNLREYLDSEGTGNYEWDRLDGYDDEGKGGLVRWPEYQEKVRNVVTQGFIDPEDFNGDPEMNKLGETGIRTSETKKRMREEAKNRAKEMNEVEGEPAATKQEVAKSKRARANEDSDEEGTFEESKPAPKKRAKKVKKEVVDNLNDLGAPKTAKKGRKKGLKDEPVDEERIDGDTEIQSKLKTSTKGRKKGVKDEPVDEDGIGAFEFQTRVKGPAKGRKKALKDEPADEDGIGAFEFQTRVKGPAKGRKKALKEEPVDDENGLSDAAEVAKLKPIAVAKRSRKKAVEESIDEQNSPDAFEEIKPKTAAKKTRKRVTKKVIEQQHDIENRAEEGLKGEDFEASDSISAIPTVEDTAMTGLPAIASEARDTKPAAVPVSKAQPKKNGRSNVLDMNATEKPTSTRTSRGRKASKN